MEESAFGEAGLREQNCGDWVLVEEHLDVDDLEEIGLADEGLDDFSFVEFYLDDNIEGGELNGEELPESRPFWAQLGLAKRRTAGRLAHGGDC